jgi:hypothetical protein
MNLWRFRPFRYCKNFGAKRAEQVQLMHKFVQRSCVGIFRNERTRSTLLYSNWCFGMFWTFSSVHELRRKTGRTCAINAQVRATKSCRNFSQRTHPIHPIWIKTHVLGVSDRFVTARTLVQNGPNCSINALVSATKSRRKLSERTHPIDPIGPQTHIFMRFGPFCYSTHFSAK